MTPKQITRKIISIDRQIKGLTYIKTEFQELCDHSDVKTKHYGSSGNYDPSADCYWVDYTCNICSKRWTVYN